MDLRVSVGSPLSRGRRLVITSHVRRRGGGTSNALGFSLNGFHKKIAPENRGDKASSVQVNLFL